jgi:hypothetical protein
MQLYPRQDIRLSEIVLRRGSRVAKLRNKGDERFVVEAFDLESDPIEALNVFDPEDPRDRQAATSVREHKARLVASVLARLGKPTPGEPSREESEAALRALGYIQ